MNTQKNQMLGEFTLTSDLVDDLHRLAALTLDKFPDMSSGQGMLIARLVAGLSEDEWLHLVNAEGLDSWLGIPLRKSASESVEALTNMLDHLVFQRDHDPLTGLANRRFFDHSLEVEVERASRTGSSLSLVMLDLDYFKNVNDERGHACGDLVLIKTAELLKESQRPYDLSARVGGEEFAIILPGVPAWRAKNMAERLLRDFRSIVFECDGTEPFALSFSAGISGIGPEVGYKRSGELYKQADAAMYDSKNCGRNRVSISTEGVHSPADAMVHAQEKQFLFTCLES